MEAASGLASTGGAEDEGVDSVVVLRVDEEAFAFALLVDVGGAGRGRRKPDAPRRRMMGVRVVVARGRVPVIVLWFGSVGRVGRRR